MLKALEWKLYALVAAAFVLGLIGWRKNGISRALDAQQAKITEAKLAKQKEMQDAGANVDDSESGIVDRLRDNGF